MHNVTVRIKIWSRFGGLSKFGRTPGGGIMAGPFSLAAVGAIRNIPVVRCRFQVETDQEGRMNKERTHSEILDRCRDKFIKEETMTKKFETKNEKQISTFACDYPEELC
jgi:hypothetical protein